jgi:hypothetical protein
MTELTPEQVDKIEILTKIFLEDIESGKQTLDLIATVRAAWKSRDELNKLVADSIAVNIYRNEEGVLLTVAPAEMKRKTFSVTALTLVEAIQKASEK